MLSSREFNWSRLGNFTVSQTGVWGGVRGYRSRAPQRNFTALLAEVLLVSLRNLLVSCRQFYCSVPDNFTAFLYGILFLSPMYGILLVSSLELYRSPLRNFTGLVLGILGIRVGNFRAILWGILMSHFWNFWCLIQRIFGSATRQSQKRITFY